MRNKVYQITLNESVLKRIKRRLEMSVHAHSEYAESKNEQLWEDLISKCLADDLFNSFKELDNFLNKLLEDAKVLDSASPELTDEGLSNGS